ncbi:unnamed protein product [Notodromas monacha]|uniref:Uncharacterized protein n=1 Tax=Notodromas monacha TaxID=399045 RepID=A0A7R9GHB0_9CRUS|nr:unnamed protein product [Notodromas monacha]CAG0921286.1 unnamed protein product [Notodromas monacha]
MQEMHDSASVSVHTKRLETIGLFLAFGTFFHWLCPISGAGMDLLTGHVPGPFYYRQENVVEKPWKDLWDCVGNLDFIVDVPEPYLREKVRRSGIGHRQPRSSSVSRNPFVRANDKRGRRPRLLHGDAAATNDFPYVVSIVNSAVPREGVARPRSPSSTGRRQCAGAIIHRRHILTAASCVSG